jgi:hypothetical protein
MNLRRKDRKRKTNIYQLDKYERKWAFILLPNELSPTLKTERQAVPEATMLPRRSQKWA